MTLEHLQFLLAVIVVYLLFTVIYNNAYFLWDYGTYADEQNNRKK